MLKKTTELNERQKEIYDALGIKYQAGGVTKVYI